MLEIVSISLIVVGIILSIGVYFDKKYQSPFLISIVASLVLIGGGLYYKNYLDEEAVREANRYNNSGTRLVIEHFLKEAIEKHGPKKYNPY